MIIVKTPELAESVAEATLLDWQKQPGDAVAEGEILVSVETDKIVLEVYAPQGGVLQEILKKEGDSVVSDEPLARIDETAQAAAAPAPAPKAAKKPQPAPAPVAAAAPATSEAAAMPSARKIAAERGIELSAIEGSGRGGRITKSDALAATTQSSSSAPAAGRETQREPMSRLRARVAERMLLSQRQSASLTTFNEADMSAIIALRRAHRDAFEARHGVKLGFMGFFVKAATAALIRHPVVNSSIDGGEILRPNYCDICVAVSAARGLVAPVLRDAERMSIAQIEAGIADFAARAKDGSLTLEDLTGGTFTVTNGGVFGSMMSTPILNPPQSAILGMHAIKERAVVVDGAVVARPMMNLALTYDHRLIDGADAVLFLVAIKSAIEDPARLLLEV